ncbi:MAG: hypothetical protein JOZ97_08435 [Candidatus Eremiobacteraeota bacterium]|nr:hypothetical protein [Candidatus Eremiobacteraeota bacterium]
MRTLQTVLLVVATAAIFLLAVAASTQGATVGLPQSVLLLLVVLIGVRVFRGNRDAMLKPALLSLVLGVLLHPWQQPLVQALSDALFALSLTIVAVYVIGPPLVRLWRRVCANIASTTTTLARPALIANDADAQPARQPAAWRLWLPFILAAAVCVSLILIGSGSLIGLQSAALQWNAHVLTSSVMRAGVHLRDPAIISAGTPAFIGVPDSLLLSVLKMVDPNAWAAFFANVVTLLSIGAFVIASLLFLQRLAFGWAASVIATTLFLLLPIGLYPRFAAPFDLSIALLALLPALSGRAKPATFLAAAFTVGFCNTANGYEYAALLAVLRAFNFTRAELSSRLYALAAILGIAGSLVASLLMKGLAPSLSLREAWWFAQELPRIVWAEALPVWWLAIFIFAILAVAGFYAMVRARPRRLLETSLVLAVGGGILALPTHAGGIPLISFAYVLQLIAPQGWPTARFLELAAFGLTIPIAFATGTFFASLGSRAQFTRAAVVWASALILFALSLPQVQRSVLPRASANTAAVEFPIAEGGSRAGIIYAQDFFAAKARMLQPLIFVDIKSPLDLQSSPEQSQTIAAMRGSGVKWIVLRSDIYANPSARTVEPRLFSPAFSTQPPVDAGPWKVITYTTPGGGN